MQCTAIFSLRRIPKDRTVYLALENTGCCPVNCSNTYKNKINNIIEIYLLFIFIFIIYIFIYKNKNNFKKEN